MKTAIFLDDQQERHDAFDKRYSKEYEIVHCYTFASFFKVLTSSVEFGVDIDLISLDHDLGTPDEVGDGRMAAKALILVNSHEAVKDEIGEPYLYLVPSVIIHSWNPQCAQEMKDILLNGGFDVTVKPFGIYDV